MAIPSKEKQDLACSLFCQQSLLHPQIVYKTNETTQSTGPDEITRKVEYDLQSETTAESRVMINE